MLMKLNRIFANREAVVVHVAKNTSVLVTA